MSLIERIRNCSNLMSELERVALKNKYPIFHYNDTFKHNINIWGIRSVDDDTTKFNDVFIWFYTDEEGIYHFKVIEGTTDPSKEMLVKPISSKGTAIMPLGHKKALWKIGLHKGYKALIQNTPVTVYRDNNKNDKIDSNTVFDTGMFGINFHRASQWKVVDLIGAYSAGCQVVKSINDWNNYILPMLKVFEEEGQKTFSYTLISEYDLDI